MECKISYGIDFKERLCEAVKGLPQKAGVVFIGPDGPIKSESIKILRDFLHLDDVENPLSIIDSPRRTDGLEKNLADIKWPHLVDLQYVTCAIHGVRHTVVESLRRAGAEKVVGIYIIDHAIFGCRAKDCHGDREKLARSAARSLNAAPPTADGLDLFITVL